MPDFETLRGLSDEDLVQRFVEDPDGVDGRSARAMLDYRSLRIEQEAVKYQQRWTVAIGILTIILSTITVWTAVEQTFRKDNRDTCKSAIVTTE